MDPRFIPIFVAGFLGGLGAFLVNAPMPFLLGGIVGTAVFVLWYEQEDKELPKLSRWVRWVFMSIIGTMIGSRFSPEHLTLIPQFWLSGLALIPFILLAHGGNFIIMSLLTVLVVCVGIHLNWFASLLGPVNEQVQSYWFYGVAMIASFFISGAITNWMETSLYRKNRQALFDQIRREGLTPSRLCQDS